MSDAGIHTARRDPTGLAVLVTSVGAATGARAAAAALAAAASEPDRAALLIDLRDGRRERPSLVATAAARALEERLVAHLPEAAVASRGAFCQLTLPPDPGSLNDVSAALPVVRDSVTVVHLPPSLLQPSLADPRLRATAALLRADLVEDRALASLVAGDLIRHGLRVAVLKRPPGRLATRAALLGMALPFGETIPVRLRERLLGAEDSKFRRCYDGEDDEAGENRAEVPRRERRGRS